MPEKDDQRPDDQRADDEPGAGSRADPPADDGDRGGGDDVESELSRSLREWDERHANSDDDPEAEYRQREEELQQRLEALEGDNKKTAEELEAAQLELADRHEFDEAVQHTLDKHDHSRVIDDVLKQVGCDRRMVELSLMERWASDEAFRDALDARYQDPATADELIDEFADDLAEKYPPSDDDHGLASAVRSAGSSVGYSAHDFDESPNYSQMSDQEFNQHKREVFQAAKSGKFSTGKKGGGFFSTSS